MTRQKTESQGRLGTLIRLLRYLTTDKARMVAVSFLFLIGISGFILISVLFGQAVNLISSNGSSDDLFRLTFATLSMALLSMVTLLFAFRGLAVIAQHALYVLRKDLFGHMQTLSLNFFDRRPIGELMSRVTNDIDTVIALFQNPLGILVMGMFMLVLTILAMLALNPFLTLVSLVVIPLLMGFVYILARVAAPAFELLQTRLSDLNGLMEETLTGQRTVIAYRQQERESEKLDTTSEQARDVGARAQLLSLIINPLTTMCTYLDIGIVALVGSAMVVRGTLSVGDLASFLSLTLLFIFPLYAMFANYNFVLSAIIGAGRIFTIIDEEADITDRPGAQPIRPVEGHVVFSHVDFSYVKGRKILRDNTFEALPGQMIGLCGPTGAGKSTIINILTRYYDIDSGTITIDGQDIYDITQDSLRQQIGVVLQEPFLFTDTVMNNLKYAREGATEEECILAAQEANCDDFVRRLPDGYNTLLVDGGSNLSQGQRQLLTIARLMVANPRMIILDEATSNVDTRTERAIQEALRKLQAGRTSFVIAHRLSTIRNAHKILVINKGEIVEQGAHNELMEKRGFYYDLFMSQFKGRIADILPGVSESSPGGEPV
jgi:ATP-binding cassette subfamily B protein